MNKRYNLKLDLQFRCNNSIMKFNQFDNNTSDFFMRITNGGKLVDIEKAIVVLAAIKPSGKVASQFVEVENGLVYADLKASMKDEIGIYTAQAMLILEDERIVTEAIAYEVEEDKIFSLLNDSVEATEEFTLLTDMLSRLSTIEISEEQRVINEAERILSEENRKIEEAKRVEAELIRQHEEADRAKYDATRESNENIRKQNEEARISSENVRLENEAKRVEEEANRVKAEQLRKDNYNFMTEDEERRRLEANAHKEAEILRVQAETNRVNEEAKRRTTEQARVSAENTRVGNENTRKANETTRQTNETQRVEAETQRQNRYNSFIADAEANANNFENYTNTAKVKEEERKSNELDRKSQEARRVSNEVERISNENTRKANEKAREKNETSRQYVFENKVDEVDKKIIEINATKDNFVSSVNTKVDSKISELDNTKSDMATSINNKVNEVENRFNALTSKQQQDAEVIDARDGETSLKARLDRDIEKAKQVYVDVEGSHISTDSSVGYAKDVEILGNTVQSASNLADIRSVGDKVEGQELYEIPVLIRGKNLFNGKWERGYALNLVPSSPLYGKLQVGENYSTTQDFIKVSPNEIYYFTNTSAQRWVIFYDKDKNPISHQETWGSCTTPNNTAYIRFYDHNTRVDAFPNYSMSLIDNVYEPYIEDKLTILSPVQIEKVGDVRDRIIEKDGVLGVEKNVIDYVPKINYASDIKAYNNIESSLYRGFFVYFDDVNITNFANKPNVISNYFSPCGDKNNITSGLTNGCIGGFDHNAGRYYIAFSILKSELSESTNTGVFEWFKNKEDLFFKVQLSTPQFIPLPHDQQVKLRTFANKTNISFLTEIEGTIKAQVPKSLGATVNTHTEQINNLNKELDRVKKLEESTVSTVTTESDFTTVEATSNGYFEDVKLEGKTLVVNTNNEVVEPGTEGATLKSVGQSASEDGADEIVVSSMEKNIVKYTKKIIKSDGYACDFEGISSNDVYYHNLSDKKIRLHIKNNNTYVGNITIHPKTSIQYELSDGNVTYAVTLTSDYGWEMQEYDIDRIFAITRNNQSDKKRLLYYNNETQAWEKPILRKWDSIEKHANGKYYYHQRSGAKVLNGSENWNNDKNSSTMSPATYRQSIQFDAIDIPSASFDTKTSPNIISDLLPTVVFGDVYSYNHVGISISGTDSVGTHIIINNNFTDVTELKQWLQTNNLTVVYQLAEEKVYECTNIDLITYNGETNYLVNSGAIVPRTTLKVHSNISNVVSLLQKKVSLLESNVTSYMITQNRLMLASRYNADTVSFKVDVASFSDTFEYDNDLYELILNNILVGKDNYNREYIENLTRFYWMDFVISDEMYSTLFEIIEEQHNPKIEEETPLI